MSDQLLPPLPHSHPFHLLDRVIVDVDDREGEVMALRRWSRNDPLIDESYPPRIYLAEMMAQCAGLAARTGERNGGGMIVKIDRLRLRKAPSPGCSVVVYARTVKRFRFDGESASSLSPR